MNLISTIIPVYSRPSLLREAVDSVLAQTYRPIEIIIVDDGSTDSTPEVAEELRSLYPDIIRVLHQVNGGPGRARQAGLDTAQGEYVQFLDSDDLLLPRKFELQVEALHCSPSAEIAYGISYEENNVDGPSHCEGPLRATGSSRKHLFPLLLNERWWTTSSPLYRRRLLDRVRPIQPWINEEDWEYDARCAAAGAQLVHVNAVVSLRRLFKEEDHLSSHGSNDPCKLAHRALAQQSIFNCARAVGVSLESPEMIRFSRSAFLLSRQCAEAGLESEADDLQQLAHSACVDGHVPFDLRFYAVIGRRIGWRNAARFSHRLRSLLLFSDGRHPSAYG